MNYVQIVLCGYVNLPPDSKGIRGWWRGTEVGVEDDEKPVLVLVEFPRDSNTHIESSTLVLSLQAMLFNAARLAYKARRKVVADAKNQLHITYIMKNELTDTFVVLARRAGDLIIAFKGTKSLQNIRTDLNVRRE